MSSHVFVEIIDGVADKLVPLCEEHAERVRRGTQDLAARMGPRPIPLDYREARRRDVRAAASGVDCAWCARDRGEVSPMLPLGRFDGPFALQELLQEEALA